MKKINKMRQFATVMSFIFCSQCLFANGLNGHTGTGPEKLFSKVAGDTSYKIRSYKAANGTVSPLGYIIVSEGGSQTYTFTPDSGYEVRNVFIDGDSVGIGAVTSYTFENVNASHTIRASYKAICTAAPKTPGVIAVSQKYNLCSADDTVTCSIKSVSNATSYTWTVPAGSTLVSGQGTNTAQVVFGADSAFTSGRVSVTANNSCGSSSAKTSVVLYSRPSQPVISGDTCVAAKDSGLVYTVTNVESNVGYTWKVPGSAKITSGQGTSSVTVTWKDSSGVISVTASNDCGSKKGSLNISTTCTNKSSAAAQAVISAKLKASVSPNPVKTSAVLYISNNKAAVSVSISNMSGKTLWQSSGIKTSQINLPVQNLASGVYFVKVSNGISSTIVKVVKE